MVFASARALCSSVVLLSVVLSGCGGSSSSGSVAPSTHEPNDTLSSCSFIVLDFYHPSLSLNDSADEDYFCFTLPIDSRLDVAVQFVHADGDIDLEVLDGTGLLVDSSTSLTDGEVTGTLLAAGDYAVRIFSPTGETNTYSLEVRAQRAYFPDAYELNSDILSCSDVALDFHDPGLNLHNLFDEDYFCFDLGPGAFLTVTVTFIHGDGNIDVMLMDILGIPISISATDQNVETITAILISGRYVVRVYSPVADINAYTLDIDAQ